MFSRSCRGGFNSIAKYYNTLVLQIQSNAILIAKFPSIAKTIVMLSYYCKKYCKILKVLQKLLQKVLQIFKVFLYLAQRIFLSCAILY